MYTVLGRCARILDEQIRGLLYQGVKKQDAVSVLQGINDFL